MLNARATSRCSAREAQARWSGRAQQEGRHVACAPDEPATAVGNSDDLATSLDNLIENALEHSPSGGNVTIAWGAAAGDEAFIAASTTVPHSPEDAAVAFERFQRGAARPPIGLAIAE